VIDKYVPSSSGLVIVLCALAACGRGAERSAGTPAQKPPVGDPAEPAPGATPAAAATKPTANAPAVVVLTPAGHDAVRVTVELARSEEEKRRGLMYRQNLAPEAGMLFLFPEDEIHTFWMKNTLIPLDMIFIRKDGTVAGVVENAEPKTLTGRSVDKESRHVLEVNGGYARLHGITEGTRVGYQHMDMTGYDQ